MHIRFTSSDCGRVSRGYTPVDIQTEERKVTSLMSFFARTNGGCACDARDISAGQVGVGGDRSFRRGVF